MESEHELIGCRIGDLKEQITSGFQSIHEKLDAIDSRTRQNEQAIAVLDERTSKNRRKSFLIGGSGGLISGAAILEVGKWIANNLPHPK